MKKILPCIFLGCLLVSLSLHSNAQFGIKGGLNLSELTNAGYQANRSVTLGGFANFSINEEWSFQPEIIFSAQGAKQIILGEVNNTYLSYANVPLLLQYKFENGFRLHSGPQFGVLASARRKNEAKGTSYDLTTNVKATDLAWVLGVSYLSYKRIGFDVRTVPGIVNISKSPPNIRNNVFQATLFYQFKRVHQPK